MNIQGYSVALLTSFEINKNTSAVARESGKSQSDASRFLHKASIDSLNFVPFVQTLFGNKSLTFVIDDFVLRRFYSQETEGTSSMVDQSTKSFTNGIKIVAGGLTDGHFFLPLDLEHWVAQFIMGTKYLTKSKLAQKLILKVLKLQISINYFVLDGLYFSEEFINFLDNRNLKFTIKAKTTTSVLYKGKKMALKDCPDLRLNNNQNQKKIIAEWCGKEWYFIAIRRSGKHGPKTIYLIANFNVKSKIYAKIYRSRWVIEKFIRTGKQSIGLKDSLAQQATVYLNHVKCVFIAYGILQIFMKKFRLPSAEDALRKVRALKFKYEFRDIVDQISLLVHHA